MSSPRSALELLAPAKNAEFGIEAINHGADAVYIGGPAFGARANAGNEINDIERLAAHAHRYSARVLVALNTILKDEELDEAQRIAWQVYEAGADALIVQDMGLLELELPPIQLHASTQTDNRTAAKVKFLEEVGFSQVVLARELSLSQIRDIAAQTSVALEFFIHGALCVSYSGQCYVSHAQTGRSANRGECSQMCRLPMSLEGSDGEVIVQHQHLLSLKDNNQTSNLRALAEAGISSFKIEGRLKDLSYVKNVTAHYRSELDRIIDALPHFSRSSAGRCSFLFTPQPEKSFNRGSTDYFVNDRHEDIHSPRTPKFAGEPIGTVRAMGRGWFELDTTVTINNGDGLSYFNTAGELVGVRVNRAEGRRLFPAEMDLQLSVGTEMQRNRDQAFERLLEKRSAERRIGVRLHLSENGDGFTLAAVDEEGNRAEVAVVHAREPAQNSERALATLREQLGKLGNTIFHAEAIELELSQAWFLPASLINALRRDVIEQLERVRAENYRRPSRAHAVEPPAPYPETALSYLGNVFNKRARAFYAKHGVSLIEEAYECNQEHGEVSLMITKHCLRYSFNLCPKQVKGIRPDPMVLVNGRERMTLRFDCKKCEMHLLGTLKARHAS
ncbi:MAG TPA: U32 family peptidase [Gammaproteobacteria bacterium]